MSKSSSKIPVYLLVLVCNLIYVGAAMTDRLRTVLDMGGINRAAVEQGEYYRLVTSMFLHFNVTHLCMNMMALLVFGRWFVEVYSGRRFCKVYFISGLLSSLGVYLLSGYDVLTAGASGAIYGVYGYIIFAVLLGKHSRIGNLTKNTAVLSFIWAVAWNFTPGVSVAGHLSGMAAGIIMVLVDGYVDKAQQERRWKLWVEGHREGKPNLPG